MAFTKILGPGIHTLANFHSHNINSSGIITATKFVGDMEASSGSTGTFDSLTVTGDLSVVGSLNYTNVTDIYSVGLGTFASNVQVGAGISVVGVSTFTNGVGIADTIFHIGDTDSFLGFPGDNLFKIATGGSTRIYIDSAGLVWNRKDTSGVSTTTMLLNHATNANGNGVSLAFAPTQNYPSRYSSIDVVQDGNNNMDMLFKTTDANLDDHSIERLRIESDGKVGMGLTSTAGGKCDPDGNALLIRAASTFGTKNGHIMLTGDSATVGQGPQIVFSESGSGANWAGAYIGHVRQGGGSLGDLVFATRQAVGDVNTVPVEALRITSGGDVEFSGTAAGVSSAFWDASEHGLVFQDDSKAFFGAVGAGVSIYWTGARAKINSTGSNLDLESDYIALKNQANSKEYLNCTNNDAVKIYYNHAQKFATTGEGISVTGEVAASQDYPDIQPALDLNFAASRSLDPRITYYRNGVASYIDEFGIVKLVGENTPRFDHDPDTGECKGLLIEDSRTNLFPYGTTPGDNWSGAKANSTWTENTTEVKAPDGTYTATKWAFTGTDPYLYHQGTLSANTTYTMSIWVKAGTNMSGDVLQSRMGAAPYATFGNSTLSTDGSWKRLTFTKTVGGSNETNVNIGWEPQTNPSGNPASGDVVYIWGAQLEVGGFASSFIPTNGTTETRFGDFVSITGDEHTDFWNPTEGTYLIDYKPLEVAVGDGIIIGSKRGSNGSGYPWPLYRYDTANTNNFKSYDLDTGIISMSTSWVDRRESWALGFNGTNGSIVRNGTQVVTNNTSMKGLIDANELWLGSSSTGSLYSMHVKRFMYYRKRISDSQLVTITS